MRNDVLETYAMDVLKSNDYQKNYKTIVSRNMEGKLLDDYNPQS